MRLTLVLIAALLANPTQAAGPTARVTGDINIRSGPSARYDVIGKLSNGTEVALDYCTTDDRWCRIANSGWVDASYLVGWSVKIQATPPDFMDSPFWQSNDEDDWPGW